MGGLIQLLHTKPFLAYGASVYRATLEPSSDFICTQLVQPRVRDEETLLGSMVAGSRHQ